MIGQGKLLETLNNALVEIARTKLTDEGKLLAITDMHILFMKPSTGCLTVKKEAIGGGKNVCFCSVELRDSAASIVAKALGTVRYQINS